jgi:predicted translin family RNA/ssDNA-binding protein
MADDSTELRLAKAYREEAEQIKKAAEQDLEAARYERGQADHARRSAEDNLRAAAECKQWLEQHDEAKVRAIVADAEQKLAEAKALKADYDAAKHGAAIALQQINEREKAERSAA